MAISQFLESDSHALGSPWFPMHVCSKFFSFLCWSGWPVEPWENPVAKRRTFTKHRNNVMTCQPRMENIFCAALFVCRPWGLVGSGKHNSTQPILPQLAFEPRPWARVVLLLVYSKKKVFASHYGLHPSSRGRLQLSAIWLPGLASAVVGEWEWCCILWGMGGILLWNRCITMQHCQYCIVGGSLQQMFALSPNPIHPTENMVHSPSSLCCPRNPFLWIQFFRR